MEKVRLRDITINMDNRRKPLNSIDREKISIQKLYPYCGANAIMDYVDEYIFDEEILCIAEDGGKWGKNEECSYIMQGKCWVNNHAHVIKVTDKVDIRYLKYWLNYNDLNAQITGAIVRKLTQKALNELEIIIPEKNEQLYICNKLDKVQEIIDIRKKQIEELDELIKCQFINSFENGRYEKVLIKDAITKKYLEKPLDGNHGNKHPKASDYVESGVPFLMANNLENGYVDLVNCNFITKEQADSLDKGFARDNDVLITHKGTIGRTAILHTNYEYVMLTPQITYYRPNHDYLLPEYLKAYFDSENFQSVMKTIASSGSTRAYIGITEQQKLELTIPPIELQNQFAEFVKQIEKQKFEIQKSLEEMKKLQESLMNKYFG